MAGLIRTAEGASPCSTDGDLLHSFSFLPDKGPVAACGSGSEHPSMWQDYELQRGWTLSMSTRWVVEE